MPFRTFVKPSKKSETLFDPAALEAELKTIGEKTELPGFWDDHESAQKLLKEKKAIENKLNEFQDLKQELDDMEILISLAEETQDESVVAEIEEMHQRILGDAETLRIKTLLTGEYDGNNAILHIHAGSGGTDAQDWAEILLRMYTRWAERKGYKVKTLDLQEDTEGGVKSVTLLIEGENAYGYLKNEKGVHRLVRISPFDAGGRRHTSFSSVDVMPEIDEDLSVEIDEEDLRIDTFRSSGAGGQHDKSGIPPILPQKHQKTISYQWVGSLLSFPY